MTEDQIIKLAIQGHASTYDAIRWAIKQEREACVQALKDAGKEISESHWDYEYDLLAKLVAKKIMERGEK